jgi:hypothetical protein
VVIGNADEQATQALAGADSRRIVIDLTQGALRRSNG